MQGHNHSEDAGAYVEHGPGHSQDPEAWNPADSEAQGFDLPCGVDQPVAVTVTHYRHRLGDSEGYCIKYILDALVHFGLLEDDSPKQIPQRPTERHYKIPKDKDEYIIIEIRPTKEK